MHVQCMHTCTISIPRAEELTEVVSTILGGGVRAKGPSGLELTGLSHAAGLATNNPSCGPVLVLQFPCVVTRYTCGSAARDVDLSELCLRRLHSLLRN
jgi:hypothetical protein